MKNRKKTSIENVIESSFFYNIAVFAIYSYQSFENNIEEFYRQSHIGECFFSFFHFFGVIFHNSLIGRMTEMPEENTDFSWEILLESRVFRYLLSLWNRMQEKVLIGAAQSQTGELFSSVADSFFNRPLQIGGQVVLVAVTLNSLLSLLLAADVSLFGVIMRAALFALSFLCLFSECDWRDLKETSCVARKYFYSLNE